MKDNKIQKLAFSGLMAALAYVVFTFLQFKITLPGGDVTSIHLGNAVCVLAALLLGGLWGGLAGAVGLTIGDLFDPVYVLIAPKTFLLKFLIGLIVGFVAHKIGHITKQTEKKIILRYAIASAVCGLVFNAIFDPFIGYYYKILILGRSAADLMLVWNVASSSINAVISTVVSVVIYMAVRPVLEKTGMLPVVEKETELANND